MSCAVGELTFISSCCIAGAGVGIGVGLLLNGRGGYTEGIAVAPGVGSMSMSWTGEEGRGGKSRGDSNEDRTGLGASVEDDGPGTGLGCRGSVVCNSRCWGAGLYGAEIRRPWLYGLDIRVISGSMGPCILWGDPKADSRLEVSPDELVDFSED